MTSKPTQAFSAEAAHSGVVSAPLSTLFPPSRNKLLPLCRAAIFGGLLLTIAGRLGRMAWWLDIWSHFALQIGLGLGLLAIVVVALRDPRWAIPAGIAAAFNLALLAPFFAPAPVTEAGTGQGAVPAPNLHVLAYNVLKMNHNTVEVTDYVRSQSPDVLALIETNDRWLEAVEQNLPGYEVVTAVPRPDNFGMLLAIRRDREDLVITQSRSFEDLSSEWPLVPTIEAQLELGGRPLDLLVVHTMPPHHIGKPHMRDSMLRGAFAWAAGRECPHLIVGDFNTTPIAPSFRAMLDGSALTDSSLGHGYQATWPIAPISLLGIPIDHALLGPGLRLTERRIGPSMGSDHRALHVTIALDE